MVLLQHFRGNLDNWDPAPVDAPAHDRVRQRRCRGTTGATPPAVEAMARDAVAFLDATAIDHADLLGFSLGSFVAQEIALTRRDPVRGLILASSAPRGGSGMHGWSREVIGAVGGREPNIDGVMEVFFTPSVTSRQAGKQALGRMFTRTIDRDVPTTWQTRQAQYDAVCGWGIPGHSVLQRVTAIDVPVLVADGDSDPMILPRYSYLLAGLLPDARIRIYPDAAHGFLFQHNEQFAADVHSFLDELS